MTDRYLWNGTGEPDPEVVRLEEALASLRHRPRPLDWTRLTAAPPASGTRWPSPRVALALAASLVLVAAGVSWWRPSGDPNPRRATGWTAGGSQVPSERWMETDATSSLRLDADGVGTVEIGPGSRVRVRQTSKNHFRLALARGTLHAFVWAPPGRFAVETPSATAVDLGCSYTLQVDAAGEGRLRVESGWVGLDSGLVEAFVPAQAICRIRPDHRLGTPRFEDAPARFVEALDRIDQRGEAASRDDILAAVAAARPRDAFSLWHLLSRQEGANAALVYDGLAALAPPPAAASRARVLSRDRAALESWWDTLGLGDSRLFRTWRARPEL